MDWFHNCFVSQVERYLTEKNLVFKVLLLVDNANRHSRDLKVVLPKVKVIFPPPNTTWMIQLLYQGLISTFKTYFTHRTFHHLLDAMDSDPELTVEQCWKQFNIAHCIGAIKELLNEVTASIINACWQNLWPQAVNNFTGFPANKERH